jgi:hypothetical protein
MTRKMAGLLQAAFDFSLGCGVSGREKYYLPDQGTQDLVKRHNSL